MSKLLERLNLIAVCLLGGVLAAVMVAQVLPGGQIPERYLERAKSVDWPKTLQLAPAHKGDPVRLVKILKAGIPLVPGQYKLPRILGHYFDYEKGPVAQWLGDMSFVVANQGTKSIVSVGISLVLPMHETEVDCRFVPTPQIPRDPLCVVDPDWCDGGCPALFNQTFSWGFVPAMTASGLEARYRAEHRWLSSAGRAFRFRERPRFFCRQARRRRFRLAAGATARLP